MRALILAIFITLFGAPAALACSCGEFTSAADQAARTDAIFRGRALETRPLEGVWSTTTFQVLAPLKLPDGAQSVDGRIDILHYAVGTGACGIAFEPNEETLVAAVFIRGGLYTNYCRAPRFGEAAFRRALNLPAE